MRNLILTLIIWVMAFTAITAGVVLTYDWYRTHGMKIKINFQDASGLVSDQSKLIYRGVVIGTINKIYLDTKTHNPVVEVRIAHDAAHMLGKDSKFWIVRPELGITGVRNLGAISTGNYVAVEPVDGPLSYEFQGAADEPDESVQIEGLRIVLRAQSANGITVGTPILYHGLSIGEIGGLGVAKDRRTILLTAYIEQRFANIVRRSSYFGNVSGFHTSLHLFGASNIDVDSMKSLLTGGISMFTPDLGAPAAKDGDAYQMLTPEQMRGDDD